MGVRLAFLLSDMLWLKMDCVGVDLITMDQFNSIVVEHAPVLLSVLIFGSF
jgi:hypothetical protein